MIKILKSNETYISFFQIKYCLYENAIVIQEGKFVNLNNLNCFYNNHDNNAIDKNESTLFGTCFFLNNIDRLKISDIIIEDCFSDYSTAGIRLIYNDNFSYIQTEEINVFFLFFN